MKLLIQLTFNNGLGNLYCGVIEILHFVEVYKNLGYNCDLIFSSNGSSGGNKFINFIKFEDIFDVSSFKVFDSIKSIEYSINDKEFEGYTYHSTQYGPDYPGAHWWDVYFDTVPEMIFPKNQYNMSTLMSKEFIPKFLPKFNEIVYKKVELFRIKNDGIKKSIQVRNCDYNLNPTDEFKTFSEKLYETVLDSKTKFHFMSNNQLIIDKLKNLSNIKTYEFNNLELLPNDHSYYFYHKHIDYGILLDRLYDNLAEMVLLSYYDIIYYYTSLSWVSTFLYYSKSNNSEQQLININSDLTLIK